MFQSAILLPTHDQKIARAGLLYLSKLIEQDQNIRVQGTPQATATLLFSSLHGLVSLFLDQRMDPDVTSNPHQFYKQHYVPWIQVLLFGEK